MRKHTLAIVLLIVGLPFETLATAVSSSIATVSITAPILAAPGGFLTLGNSVMTRPRLSADQIRTFLPASRGPFTFPAPYNTTAARLTDASDCNGVDCVLPVGYSYWRNINQHTGSPDLYFFLTLQNAGGPTLFRYTKATGAVTKVGPLFPSSDRLSYATGEGWYFSASQPNTLYLNDGPRMVRYDIMNHTTQTVFDISTAQNIFGTNRMIWQMHSSNDDQVHSATVKDASSYASLGCMTYEETAQRFRFFPTTSAFDECNLDKSGRWLVIIDNVDGMAGEDNRIIDLATGTERLLLDQDGAAGHADLGYGTMVAADNWNALPNATRLWRFDTNPLQSTVVHWNASWDVAAANHIAYSNARADIPPEQQFACGSSASRRAAANEIICFRLDGSNTTLVVAPVMTSLDATGGGDDYAKMPKGNLDVTGEYFIWTSNLGSNRTDAFLVKIPGQLLANPSTSPAPVSPAPTTAPPAPASAPIPAPAPTLLPTPVTRAVVWTARRNVTAVGRILQKSGGCDGCEDAGAISLQRIMHGAGSASFRVIQANTLLAAGLSTDNRSTSVDDIEFGIMFNGAGSAEVRENGTYRSDIPYLNTDTFTVAVIRGRVEYKKNGVTFYTSAHSATVPLILDTALLSRGSILSTAIISY